MKSFWKTLSNTNSSPSKYKLQHINGNKICFPFNADCRKEGTVSPLVVLYIPCSYNHILIPPTILLKQLLRKPAPCAHCHREHHLRPRHQPCWVGPLRWDYEIIVVVIIIMFITDTGHVEWLSLIRSDGKIQYKTSISTFYVEGLLSLALRSGNKMWR